jgi:hypothetical protein
MFIVQGNYRTGFRFCRGLSKRVVSRQVMWKVIDNTDSNWSYPDTSFFLTGRLEIIT